MEMQFDKIPMTYLQKLLGSLQSEEQTLEVRLPDGMPDIGRVLGAWGQVIIRSKEWNGDHMAVSCGVMAWVLYTPEDEDGVRSVEAWLPFTMKWELPESQYDGKIMVSCLLRDIDARSTSARKLMLRANLQAMGEAWLTGQAQIPTPGELPEDIALLTATYPVLLPREAGEKAFLLEDTCTTGVKPEKLLYYCMQPEVLDKKVMAGKVVFRGNGNLHVLYRGDDGKLYTWDCDLPFSQYADLEGEYDQDPTVSVRVCVTSLDVAPDETGALRIKAGILGQYLLCERSMVTVVEDAYSPYRTVKPLQEQLELPAILDQINQTVHAEQSAQADSQQVIDVSFCPAYGQMRRTEKGVQLSIPGHFQTLYYDTDGELRSLVTSWEGMWMADAAQDSTVAAQIIPTGKPQVIQGVGDMTLRAEPAVYATVTSGQGIPMLTGMELGELEKPDKNRPSLILCRKGNRRLWDVAKQTGSTVERIMQTNDLDGEPDDNRVLLIPVS